MGESFNIDIFELKIFFKMGHSRNLRIKKHIYGKISGNHRDLLGNSYDYYKIPKFGHKIHRNP